METGWPELQQRRRERGLEKMGEERKEKKGKRKKKKPLKKESVKTFFLFDEECTVTLAFYL